MDNDAINSNQALKDAFLALPKVLQKAITDAHVQANLRKLAEKYKLHLDKWTVLENEIMLALLGITNAADLPHAIQEQVGIPLEQAQEITDAVSRIVFDPIQEELKQEVGESKNILETADTTQPKYIKKQKQPIDISKFTTAPTDPTVYTPKTPKKYTDNHDPYLEPIDE